MRYADVSGAEDDGVDGVWTTHGVAGSILAHRGLALHRRHRLSCLHPCSRLLCCSWYVVALRASTMPPVLSALFAFVVTGFQSRPALPLKMLALQHQGAVYTHTVRTSSTH